MLWLIVPADAPAQDNRALRASAERLQGNKAIPVGQTKKLLVSTSKAEACEKADVTDEVKVLHIVAHAGVEGGGHIGGLDLDGFAAALVAKFGTWLTGAEIYLHVCLVGRVLGALTTSVKTADTHQVLNNLSVYAPVNLMIVSKAGIPHVHGDADAKSAKVDPIVAKHDSDYHLLRTKAHENFLGTGEGWSGYELSGTRAVGVIDAQTVKEAVLETFDESEMEVNDGF